ncbi:hypothetical protein [Absidia glauca]|uniref:Uncharacterized protein n=1 Tax=Absidia glauca TaxID=4829 RepID=A0A163JJF7_ABSGL|nr:hypothetical protein [Absidia glauca]
MNKFIREHVRFTNGHDPTKDITIRFGKELMLRHIIGGGYWWNSDGQIVSLGASSRHWISSNLEDFYVVLMGGSRTLEDNDYQLQKIKEGVCAVFSYKMSSSTANPYLVGKARNQNGEMMIDCYEISDINTSMQTIRTRLISESYPLSQLNTETVIDMHITDSQGYQIINVCKFGSYWFISEHLALFNHYSEELSAFFNRS